MDQTSFAVHDVSKFPLVRLSAPLSGVAAAWCLEVEALLKDGRPFVLLYPAPDGEEPDEDRAIRGIWMMRNRGGLEESCLGLILVEPRRDRREALEAMFPGLERSFGVPQYARPDFAAAEVLARSLLEAGASRAEWRQT